MKDCASPFEILDLRSAPARWLDDLDYSPDSAIARGLGPLSAIYGAVAGSLRSHQPLPTTPPSIGVGNLRVGGTGKTPVVADLVLRLRERGLKVGVLTRGHRGQGGGDEPEWLQQSGAIVELDANRGRGREHLLGRATVDVLLLDDALQTRWRPTHCLGLALARDRQRAPRCLPAGPGRERAQSALHRADYWAWRHDGGFPAGHCPEGELHFRLRPTRWIPLGAGPEESGQPQPHAEATVAVSGLARPSSFEKDLQAAGVKLVGSVRFEDHWRPRPDELRKVEDFARRRGATRLACPEKNAVRLSHWRGALPTEVVVSEIEWWGEDPVTRLPTWWPRHAER